MNDGADYVSIVPFDRIDAPTLRRVIETSRKMGANIPAIFNDYFNGMKNPLLCDFGSLSNGDKGIVLEALVKIGEPGRRLPGMERADSERS